MPLSFETNRGSIKWPYNPEYIGFESTKLIVEHEYPYRQGAETEDMGRKSIRVEVRGTFLHEPSAKAPTPQIMMDSLWRLHNVGAVGKVFGSELGEAVEGRLFRIVNLKGSREAGTVGDIPYSFTFVEHVDPQSRSQGATQNSSGTNSSSITNLASNQKPQTRDVVYTVRKGDTLWGIAKAHYNDASKYKEIMAVNKVDVSDMVPGLKLTLKAVPNRG